MTDLAGLSQCDPISAPAPIGERCAQDRRASGRGAACARGEIGGSEKAQALSVPVVEPRIDAADRRRMDRRRAA